MVKTETVNKVKKSEKSKNVKISTQTTTPVVETSSAPVSVAATVSVAAPVSAAATISVAAPASVAEPESLEKNEEVTTEEVKTEDESNIEMLFNKFLVQFQDVQSVLKTMQSNLKILQKEVMRERKESKKKESKIKKKSDKKKSPSGFAKPGPISAELAVFLNLSPGDEIARTEATSKIIAYVKEHNLQNPANKRQIIPDEKLSSILQPGNEVVKFFNLQTFLKKHFISNKPSEVTSSSSVSVV